MDSLRKLVWGPTLEDQRRKWNGELRNEIRQLNKQANTAKVAEKRATTEVRKIAQRAKSNPAGAKGTQMELRIATKTFIDVRKRRERLETAVAQMESVHRQVTHAFSVRKIEGSMKVSTGIMRDVNALVKLPELTKTMNQMSQELMKAGIIEEMTEDSMPDLDLAEDEETEEELAKVLGDILKEDGNKLLNPDQVETTPNLPAAPSHLQEEYEDPDLDAEDMQRRLEALKS